MLNRVKNCINFIYIYYIFYVLCLNYCVCDSKNGNIMEVVGFELGF